MSGSRRLLHAAAVTAGICLFLLSFPPLQPMTFNEKLDPSFFFSLSHAVAAGDQFGRDLVFTFGPWGFLFVPFYHPDTYPCVLGCYLVLCMVLFAGLWYGAGRLVVRPGLRLLWLAGIVFLMASFSDWFFYPFPVLFILLYFFTDRRPQGLLLAALVPTLALISLVKFSFLVLNLLTMSLIAVDEVLRRKRPPWLLICYVCSVAAFWLMAGQQPGNLAYYVCNSLEIVRHYSEAVSLPGDVTYELVSCGLAALFVVSTACMAWRRLSYFAVTPVLALSLAVFVVFKASFVRHDIHGMTMCSVLPASILVFFPGLWATSRNKGWHTMLVVMLAASFGLAWQSHKEYRNTDLPGRLLEKAEQLHVNLKALVSRRRGESALQRRYAEAKRRICKELPLPGVTGSADCYPYALGVVLAHDLPYNPRPVRQSFLAYSPRLAGLNAAHLRRADAADTILFEVAALDGKYPSQEDSLSWLEILRRYNPRLLTDRFLVLKRARERRCLRLLPLDSLTMHVDGDVVTLPVSDTPLWACIEIPVSWRYRLRSLLYKPPRMFLAAATDDGNSARFRLVPSMARTGFLLSPLIEDCLEFDALYSSNWKKDLSQKRIRKIGIVSDDPASSTKYFPLPVSVALYRIEMDDPALSLVERQDARFPRSLANLIRLKESASPSGVRIRLVQGKWLACAHAPARSMLSIGPGAECVRFTFGILDGAWQGIRPTDGVDFRLSAMLDDGTTKELWSFRLDPLNNPLHRVSQSASVDVGNAHVAALVFETLPGEFTDCDWSYWSELSVDEK